MSSAIMPDRRWSVDYAQVPFFHGFSQQPDGQQELSWVGYPQYPAYFAGPQYWTLYPPAGPPAKDVRQQQRRFSDSLHSSVAPRHDRFGSGIAPIPADLGLPAHYEVRGPPRKPRHGPTSMWVGNVPRSTNIVELRDFFAADFKDNIQSVFWMAKTSCAFVNYNTAQSCKSAVDRFNQHYFKGIQLNCRLRENGVTQNSHKPRSNSGSDAGAGQSPSSEIATPETEGVTPVQIESPSTRGSPVRYFVAKSLTREDLVASTRTGHWTTQPIVGKIFEDALRTSEEVYLVFSANRSGQYFGFARVLGLAPKGVNVKDDGPKSWQQTLIRCIDTPETAVAPAGVIHDDSSRGILYWEARTVSTASDSSASPPESNLAAANNEHDDSGFRTFSLNWISTRPVSFHRTRNLFNSLNENKPVKVAKDGTEIDTNTGKALLELWA